MAKQRAVSEFADWEVREAYLEIMAELLETWAALDLREPIPESKQVKILSLESKADYYLNELKLRGLTKGYKRQ